jgi:hypothetical protein
MHLLLEMNPRYAMSSLMFNWKLTEVTDNWAASMDRQSDCSLSVSVLANQEGHSKDPSAGLCRNGQLSLAGTN